MEIKRIGSQPSVKGPSERVAQVRVFCVPVRLFIWRSRG